MTQPSAPSFFGNRSNQLDDWIAIAPDGTITAFSGKVELGTGVRTALAQIVAEELDVPFERVRMVMGDTERTPDEGYTAGSMTIQLSGSALRQAAAEARRALLEMASERLDAAPDELVVRDGVIAVSHHPAQTITYAELMGGQKFAREVKDDAPLKNPNAYRVVGTSVPRVDIPPKLTGQPSFVQDLRIEGMLHGRVVRPPSVGASVVTLDENSVADIEGLIKVVHIGNNESFMDELAAAAQSDPLAFRLRHLQDERAREALRVAAERAGWDARPSPRAAQNGLAEGRGLAFAQYENDGAIVACIAFAQVDTTNGAVRVRRIVAAHDCGLIINPDGAQNQIEGNLIQALSRALKEEVTFDQRRVTSVDWQTYPILTFSEVPDVEVALINRPDQPAVGVGEPAMVAVAAAVANAIFDATGARVRQVPFTPPRVLAALRARSRTAR